MVSQGWQLVAKAENLMSIRSSKLIDLIEDGVWTYGM